MCGCPRHEPGPPETLTDTDYANLLRVPDRRTIAGKRDYALLRVLGRLRPSLGGAARPAGPGPAPPARQRPPPPPLRARQGRARARGPGPRGRPAGARGVDGGPSARARRRPARRAAVVRAPRPPRRPGASPPLRRRRAPARAPLTATPPACPSGSRTRTRSGPTGPPICSRPVSPCTRSPRGSGTSTCGRPRATPRRGPSGSMRSPRCSIAATTPRGGRVGGRSSSTVNTGLGICPVEAGTCSWARRTGM